MTQTGSDADSHTDFSDASATLGDRLHFARERTGLDAAALAARLGVAPGTIEDWEHDRSEPRASRMQMIAGLLDVSLRWLITGEGAAPRGNGAGLGALLAELRALQAAQDDISRRLHRFERDLRAFAKEDLDDADRG